MEVYYVDSRKKYDISILSSEKSDSISVENTDFNYIRRKINQIFESFMKFYSSNLILVQISRK